MQHTSPNLSLLVTPPAAKRLDPDATAAALQTQPAPKPGRDVLASADRVFRAQLVRLTLGISPVAVADTQGHWLAHLAMSPGKQIGLMELGVRYAARLGLYGAQLAFDRDAPAPIAPAPGDRRFADEGWRSWPYKLLAQSFLLAQDWWREATTGIERVARLAEARISFMVPDTYVLQC